MCRIRLLTPGGGGYGAVGSHESQMRKKAAEGDVPVLRTGSVAEWNAQAEGA